MVQGQEVAAHKVQSQAQAAAAAGSRPVQALILTGFGINCEEEMAAAYRLAGAEATIVHLNQVLHGELSIHDFDILNFPGGFSFGDDLGSGVVLANKLRYRQIGAGGRTLLDDIRAFVAAGKFVLGICNGFQVLVKLGLLPNLGGDFQPEVTLTHNQSGRYENRWVRLKVNPNSRSPFLRGLSSLEVPVRHGEGRLVLPDEDIRARIEELGLNCLSYVDAAGDGTSQYPHNPNGADLNCAGLLDPTGRIFGLMPHPEAYLAACNHPDWPRRQRAGMDPGADGEGLAIFRNIVGHIAARPFASPPGPLSGGEGEPGEELVLAGEEEAGYVKRTEGKMDARLTTDKQYWHQALKTFGRQMRHAPTPAEDALWNALRNRQLAGFKFRRQHSIGRYIVDFFSPDCQLIIEVEGGIHQEAEQAEYDAGRTQELYALGCRLIRFSNEQVLENLPAVLQEIQTACKNQDSFN